MYMYAGLHTNIYSYLPDGQVKSSLLDFYLPKRKIYLPNNNNYMYTLKYDKHYFSLILTNNKDLSSSLKGLFQSWSTCINEV